MATTLENCNEITGILKDIIYSGKYLSFTREHKSVFEFKRGHIVCSCVFCKNKWLFLDRDNHTDDCPIKRSKELLRIL